MNKSKKNAIIANAFLMIWFVTQLYFHWYFTIFGPWEGKINYFANTIKLIPSSNIYIPDLYHIVLHILILASLISMITYCVISRKRKDNIISRLSV